MYEADLYAWANEQASLLREGRLHEADIAHIAEEIEGLARAERRELIHRLTILLTHLLKWQVQPNYRGRSWRLTIEEQRARLQTHLEDNPSLRPQLADALQRAYRVALLAAQRETGIGCEVFPGPNPWSPAQIFDDEFYPE